LGALARVQSASTLDTGAIAHSVGTKTAKAGRLTTLEDDAQYRGDYKGVAFGEFASRYGKRSDGGFGIKGYKLPRRNNPQVALSA